VRCLSASALVAVLLALGLPACGSANQSDRSEPRVPAKDGVGLKKVGEFDRPAYVTGAPGYPRLLFVVEQPVASSC
jgi:hypothetical protein